MFHVDEKGSLSNFFCPVKCLTKFTIAITEDATERPIRNPAAAPAESTKSMLKRLSSEFFCNKAGVVMQMQFLLLKTETRGTVNSTKVRIS